MYYQTPHSQDIYDAIITDDDFRDKPQAASSTNRSKVYRSQTPLNGTAANPHSAAKHQQQYLMNHPNATSQVDPLSMLHSPHHRVLYTKTETVSLAADDPHALKLDKMYENGHQHNSHHRSSKGTHHVSSSKGIRHGHSSNRAYRGANQTHSGSSSKRKSKYNGKSSVSYKSFSSNFKKWIPKYPYHRSVKKVFSKMKHPSNSRKSKVRSFHNNTPLSGRSSSRGIGIRFPKRKNRKQVYAVDSKKKNTFFVDTSDELDIRSDPPSQYMNSSYQMPSQYKARDLPPRSQTTDLVSARSQASSKGKRRRKKKSTRPGSRKFRAPSAFGSRKAKRSTSRARSKQSYRSYTPSSGQRATPTNGHRAMPSFWKSSSNHVRVEPNMNESCLKGTSFSRSGTPTSSRDSPPPQSKHSSRPMLFKPSKQVQQSQPNKYEHSSEYDHRAKSSKYSCEQKQKKEVTDRDQKKMTAKHRRSSVALEQNVETTFESLSTYKFGDQDDSYNNYNGVDFHIDLVMYQFFVSSTTERYRQFDLVEKMIEQVPDLERIGKGIDVEGIKRKMRNLAETT